MGKETHPGAAFLADMFGPSTSNPVFICSLLNAEARGSEVINERFVTTRSTDDIAGFCAKWDRPRRGLFFCVSTLAPNARRRSKGSVSEINGLHADIDFKNVLATPEEVRRVIGQLMCPPSKVNFSGNGLHCYWLFKEALAATTENIAKIENLLRLLADHVGGDPAVAEVARLMRLPGTHNTKNEAWVEVTAEIDRPIRYGLDDLHDWLTIAGPALHRKPKLNGGEPTADPFLALAARQGLHVPIDVEARLLDMTYQGPGDSSIHQTQLSVTASLLTGEPVDTVVAIVLSATRAAAGNFGADWDWRREERAVGEMCDAWLRKHPEIKRAPKSAAARKSEQEEQPDQGQQEPQEQGQQEPPKQEEQQRQPATEEQPAGQRKKGKRPGLATTQTIIADGAIEAVRATGRDLVLSDGDLHLYREGAWRPATAGEEKWLRVLIQQDAQELGEGGRLAIVHGAWKRLTEHPALFRADVQWDRLGRIALANGTLDLLTRKFGDWRPDDFLRRKLNVAYAPLCGAPHFLNFLAELFVDRTPDERAAVIGLLQEFFGASLCVRLLAREQRRALFLVGPSRTGKTELARVAARLIGKPIASPSVGQIGDRFGLATFFGAAGWVRDDAVNEGDRLDPQKFKTIVTGEAIDVERKNRAAVRVELAIPVVLTANSLPASRDASDAVFNRSLVVDLANVISEKAAVIARREAGLPPGVLLGDWLFDQEGPGILNWALAGLDRLFERGEFAIPPPVAASIQRFKDEANEVAEFARTMLEQSPATKVERGDLLCAFHGWLKEEMGDDARMHGARWLIPKLRSACPWAVDRKIGDERYFCGVELTKEALRYWTHQATDGRGNGCGAKGASALAKDVNKRWRPSEQTEELPF
jgi:P4 family phage/plasmid primase-like protien